MLHFYHWIGILSLTLSFLTSQESQIPNLIQQLQDPDPEIRSTAAWEIGQIGTLAKKAVPALIRSLKDPDRDVQRNAAYALGELGAQAENAIPYLIRALSTPDSVIQLYMAHAISKIVNASEYAWNQVLKTLKNPHKGTRMYGVKILGELGRTLVESLFLLEQTFQKQPSKQDLEIISALSKFQEQILSSLISLLQDPDKEIRITAIESLGEFILATETVKSSFMEISLKHETKTILILLETLAFRGEKGFQSLHSLLFDSDKDIQRKVIGALGNIGQKAAPCVPGLIKILSEESDSITQQKVAWALGQIASAPDQSVPALVGLLSNSSLRYTAINSLKYFGFHFKHPVEFLKQLFRLFREEGNIEERSLILQVLLELNLDFEDKISYTIPLINVFQLPWSDRLATESLIKLQRWNQNVYLRLDETMLSSQIIIELQSPDAFIRRFTLEGLAVLGKKSKSLMFALQHLSSEDPDEQVRISASWAIEKIKKAYE